MKNKEHIIRSGLYFPCEGEKMKDMTIVHNAWADGNGNIHLAITKTLIRDNGSGYRVFIPNMELPMDGIISVGSQVENIASVVGRDVRTSSESGYYELFNKQLTLLKGTMSDNDEQPYFAKVEVIEAPMREMTLQQIETALGHKVKIINKE